MSGTTIINRTVDPIFKKTVIAAANILPADIVPQEHSSVLRVTVSVNTASVLNCKLTNPISNETVTMPLNSAAALGVDQLYSFIVGVSKAFKYNFTVNTGPNIINYMVVDEIVGGII